MPADEYPHLAEFTAGHVLQPGLGYAKQIDVNPHEGLVDDMQAAFGQKPMDIGHAAVDRVLHRQHRKVRAS